MIWDDKASPVSPFSTLVNISYISLYKPVLGLTTATLCTAPRISSPPSKSNSTSARSKLATYCNEYSSIGLFKVGSVICGAAPTFAGLKVGRAIAGIRASDLSSEALLIVTQTVPLHRRPAYAAIIISISAFTNVAGSLLGTLPRTRGIDDGASTSTHPLASSHPVSSSCVSCRGLLCRRATSMSRSRILTPRATYASYLAS